MINLYIFIKTGRAAIFGIGTYIRELSVALKGSNINVCVIYLYSDKPQPEIEKKDDIWHWYIPSPVMENRSLNETRLYELYYRNVVYLLRLHIANKEHLIFHLNFNNGRVLSEQLREAFECKIITVVHYSEWGFDMLGNITRLRSALQHDSTDQLAKQTQDSVKEEVAFYATTDGVVCLSAYMKDILMKNYQLPDRKIFLIPNGLSDLTTPKSNRKQLKEKWHFSAREKIILFAGRLDEVKGLIYLLNAFRQVLQAIPRCRLVIAGDGTYNLYLKETQDICTKITYTGMLDKPALYELYRITDAGVVPSLYEPFGYVALEMMMHACPLVVTASSGLNELVDEHSGLKVAVTELPESMEIDTSLLAEKILYLLQHPVEAKVMGKNARKRYEHLYSEKVFRENMLNLYHSL
jgi:glycosyltransferase